MKNGGKRPGAGRPKGSTNRPQFKSYFTEADIKALIEVVKDQAVQDNKLLMWALDHWFGKAPQTIEGDLTGTLSLHFDNAFASPPKTNS